MNLNLSGEVMSDDYAEMYRHWGYNAGFFCPADVRQAVSKLTPGEELVLEINSIGGMVDAGTEIFSVIHGCKNPTRAVIQSMAASAASYMIQSCDRIEIMPPAQMMIHLASSIAYGNKHNLSQGAQMLDAADRSILNAYCSRCGEDKRGQLEQLMENETFLTAEDALAVGLVDAIVGSDAQSGSPALVASVTNNITRAMRTLPDIQDLIARRNNEEADQLRAELELEKYRY